MLRISFVRTTKLGSVTINLPLIRFMCRLPSSYINVRSGGLVITLCNPVIRTMEQGSVTINPSLVRLVATLHIYFKMGH